MPSTHTGHFQTPKMDESPRLYAMESSTPCPDSALVRRIDSPTSASVYLDAHNHPASSQIQEPGQWTCATHPSHELPFRIQHDHETRQIMPLNRTLLRGPRWKDLISVGHSGTTRYLGTNLPQLAPVAASERKNGFAVLHLHTRVCDKYT